jgi:hypothetical protein
VCDARLQRVSRMHLHPRTRGNAAGRMGHDCTHDGGVTEPPCRTFGWMPKSRQPGSGAQLKPLWARWGARKPIPVCTSRVAVCRPDCRPHQSPVLHPPAVASVGCSGISFTPRDAHRAAMTTFATLRASYLFLVLLLLSLSLSLSLSLFLRLASSGLLYPFVVLN